MSIIGGNLETKEIGLQIGLSGTQINTEIDEVTGFLRLKKIDTDGTGKPIYAEEGSWISDIINLEDKFTDFDKVFTSSVEIGSSTIAVLTRVSDNGKDWSDWIAVAYDGAIQSETKQYIQVKINIFAGFETDTYLVNKNEYVEGNSFVENKTIGESSYATPTLTSNTETSVGFPFAKDSYSASTFGAWKAFDKKDGQYISDSSSIKNGFLGFYFNIKRRITKYKISSVPSNFPNTAPRDFVLESSNNTTTGLDGTWDVLDSQTNIAWVSNQTQEFTIDNYNKYNAYRIRWTNNSGSPSFTAIRDLDFFAEADTTLSLKREYEFDMKLDSSWIGKGSLHRKKINRGEWLRIDSLNVDRGEK